MRDRFIVTNSGETLDANFQSKILTLDTTKDILGSITLKNGVKISAEKVNPQGISEEAFYQEYANHASWKNETLLSNYNESVSQFYNGSKVNAPFLEHSLCVASQSSLGSYIKYIFDFENSEFAAGDMVAIYAYVLGNTHKVQGLEQFTIQTGTNEFINVKPKTRDNQSNEMLGGYNIGINKDDATKDTFEYSTSLNPRRVYAEGNYSKSTDNDKPYTLLYIRGILDKSLKVELTPVPVFDIKQTYGLTSFTENRIQTNHFVIERTDTLNAFRGVINTISLKSSNIEFNPCTLYIKVYNDEKYSTYFSYNRQTFPKETWLTWHFRDIIIDETPTKIEIGFALERVESGIFESTDFRKIQVYNGVSGIDIYDNAGVKYTGYGIPMMVGYTPKEYKSQYTYSTIGGLILADIGGPIDYTNGLTSSQIVIGKNPAAVTPTYCYLDKNGKLNLSKVEKTEDTSLINANDVYVNATNKVDLIFGKRESADYGRYINGNNSDVTVTNSNRSMGLILDPRHFKGNTVTEISITAPDEHVNPQEKGTSFVRNVWMKIFQAPAVDNFNFNDYTYIASSTNSARQYLGQTTSWNFDNAEINPNYPIIIIPDINNNSTIPTSGIVMEWKVYTGSKNRFTTKDIASIGTDSYDVTQLLYLTGSLRDRGNYNPIPVNSFITFINENEEFSTFKFQTLSRFDGRWDTNTGSEGIIVDGSIVKDSFLQKISMLPALNGVQTTPAYIWAFQANDNDEYILKGKSKNSVILDGTEFKEWNFQNTILEPNKDLLLKAYDTNLNPVKLNCRFTNINDKAVFTSSFNFDRQLHSLTPVTPGVANYTAKWIWVRENRILPGANKPGTTIKIQTRTGGTGLPTENMYLKVYQPADRTRPSSIDGNYTLRSISANSVKPVYGESKYFEYTFDTPILDDTTLPCVFLISNNNTEALGSVIPSRSSATNFGLSVVKQSSSSNNGYVIPASIPSDSSHMQYFPVFNILYTEDVYPAGISIDTIENTNNTAITQSDIEFVIDGGFITLNDQTTQNLSSIEQAIKPYFEVHNNGSYLSVFFDKNKHFIIFTNNSKDLTSTFATHKVDKDELIVNTDYTILDTTSNKIKLEQNNIADTSNKLYPKFKDTDIDNLKVLDNKLYNALCNDNIAFINSEITPNTEFYISANPEFNNTSGQLVRIGSTTKEVEGDTVTYPVVNKFAVNQNIPFTTVNVKPYNYGNKTYYIDSEHNIYELINNLVIEAETFYRHVDYAANSPVAYEYNSATNRTVALYHLAMFYNPDNLVYVDVANGEHVYEKVTNQEYDFEFSSTITNVKPLYPEWPFAPNDREFVVITNVKDSNGNIAEKVLRLYYNNPAAMLQLDTDVVVKPEDGFNATLWPKFDVYTTHVNYEDRIRVNVHQHSDGYYYIDYPDNYTGIKYYPVPAGIAISTLVLNPEIINGKKFFDKTNILSTSLYKSVNVEGVQYYSRSNSTVLYKKEQHDIIAQDIRDEYYIDNNTNSSDLNFVIGKDANNKLFAKHNNTYYEAISNIVVDNDLLKDALTSSDFDPDSEVIERPDNTINISNEIINNDLSDIIVSKLVSQKTTISEIDKIKNNGWYTYKNNFKEKFTNDSMPVMAKDSYQSILPLFKEDYDTRRIEIDEAVKTATVKSFEDYTDDNDIQTWTYVADFIRSPLNPFRHIDHIAAKQRYQLHARIDKNSKLEFAFFDSIHTEGNSKYDVYIGKARRENSAFTTVEAVKDIQHNFVIAPKEVSDSKLIKNGKLVMSANPQFAGCITERGNANVKFIEKNEDTYYEIVTFYGNVYSYWYTIMDNVLYFSGFCMHYANEPTRIYNTVQINNSDATETYLQEILLPLCAEEIIDIKSGKRIASKSKKHHLKALEYANGKFDAVYTTEFGEATDTADDDFIIYDFTTFSLFDIEGFLKDTEFVDYDTPTICYERLIAGVDKDGVEMQQHNGDIYNNAEAIPVNITRLRNSETEEEIVNQESLAYNILKDKIVKREFETIEFIGYSLSDPLLHLSRPDTYDRRSYSNIADRFEIIGNTIESNTSANILSLTSKNEFASNVAVIDDAVEGDEDVVVNIGDIDTSDLRAKVYYTDITTSSYKVYLVFDQIHAFEKKFVPGTVSYKILENTTYSSNIDDIYHTTCIPLLLNYSFSRSKHNYELQVTGCLINGNKTVSRTFNIDLENSVALNSSVSYKNITQNSYNAEVNIIAAPFSDSFSNYTLYIDGVKSSASLVNTSTRLPYFNAGNFERGAYYNYKVTGNMSGQEFTTEGTIFVPPAKIWIDGTVIYFNKLSSTYSVRIYINITSEYNIDPQSIITRFTNSDIITICSAVADEPNRFIVTAEGLEYRTTYNFLFAVNDTDGNSTIYECPVRLDSNGRMLQAISQVEYSNLSDYTYTADIILNIIETYNINNTVGNIKVLISSSEGNYSKNYNGMVAMGNSASIFSDNNFKYNIKYTYTVSASEATSAGIKNILLQGTIYKYKGSGWNPPGGGGVSGGGGHHPKPTPKPTPGSKISIDVEIDVGNIYSGYSVTTITNYKSDIFSQARKSVKNILSNLPTATSYQIPAPSGYPYAVYKFDAAGSLGSKNTQTFEIVCGTLDCPCPFEAKLDVKVNNTGYTYTMPPLQDQSASGTLLMSIQDGSSLNVTIGNTIEQGTNGWEASGFVPNTSAVLTKSAEVVATVNRYYLKRSLTKIKASTFDSKTEPSSVESMINGWDSTGDKGIYAFSVNGGSKVVVGSYGPYIERHDGSMYSITIKLTAKKYHVGISSDLTNDQIYVGNEEEMAKTIKWQDTTIDDTTDFTVWDYEGEAASIGTITVSPIKLISKPTEPKQPIVGGQWEVIAEYVLWEVADAIEFEGSGHNEQWVGSWDGDRKFETISGKYSIKGKVPRQVVTKVLQKPSPAN